MHFPDLSALSAVAPNPSTTDAPLPALVAFSSSRWQFEFRRSQQLLTRLARHYRVFYIEEPVITHEDAHLASSTPAHGVELLVPHTRIEAAGFHDAQIPVLRALLADFLQERGIVEPVVWLGTPMALPLIDDFEPRAVMYDCEDDASLRPDAPRQWRQRESALLKLADVVVAAGPSLYQSRRALHPNVHCVPNAVDAEHFAPAALAASTIESISARSLHAPIPNPRLGWFGVIDERIDLALIEQVADLRPDWQLVMAGPVVGIARDALPQRPNIHWLGPQTYAIRPHLQAHWDVCLLPLKCDESTRHASPQQTLEYLAGQKSVVSTPVHDVAALYGHVVRLASGPDAFVEACRAAMCERGPLRRQRRIDALIAVHSCTWNRAADRVHRLLVEFADDAARASAFDAMGTLVETPREAMTAIMGPHRQPANGSRYAMG